MSNNLTPVSEVFKLEITPTWKWEGDEYIVGISTSVVTEKGDHILYQGDLPIDVAF